MPGSFIFIVRKFRLLAVVASLCAAGCGEKSSSSASGTNATASAGNPLDAPGNYLKTVVDAKRGATMLVDTNSLAKLIDQFNIDKGRNPSDLNELVQEKYIAKLPEPPYGTKLVYDPATGRVSIINQ